MSYFKIITIFTLSFVLQTAEAIIPESERNALLSIIQFADIEHQGYWSGASGTECGWVGVHCDAAQEHVVGLGVGFVSLTKLDSSVVQLTALKKLSLNGNLLTKLPPEIVQLTTLIDIDLSRNRLTVVPPEIFRMKALTHLNLDLNLLTVLSPEIGQLTALNVLRLHSNQLTTLPPEIGKLSALGGLLLQNNRLTELPVEIGKLKALDNLSLESNQLTELPEEIGQLKALTYLSLSSNQLTKLTAEIGQLTALKNLSLYSNQLTKLPSEISQLTALTKLRVYSNRLTELPQGIGQLTNLTSLSLDSNQLTKLPPEISRLTHLTSLSVSFNQLTALPLEITQLVSLTHLDLESNQISVLPAKIRQLTKLRSLSLRSNKLTSLLPEIGQLTELTSLNIDSNLLTALPAEIGQLTKLQELYLSKNLLSELPENLMMIKEKEDCVVLRGSDFCVNVHLSLSENCLSETTLLDNLVKWVNSRKVAINKNWLQEQKDICINDQPIPMVATVHDPDSRSIDFVNINLLGNQHEQSHVIAFKLYKEGMLNRTTYVLGSGVVESVDSDTWRIDTQNIVEGNYDILFWLKGDLSPPERKGWSRSFIKLSNKNNLVEGEDLTLSLAFNNDVQIPELSSPALSFNYPVFLGDIPLIDKIKQTPEFTSLQFNEGNFSLNDSAKRYTVRPFKVEVSQPGNKPGYLQSDDEFIRLTAGRRTILATATIADLSGFKTALLRRNLRLLEINKKGLIQVQNLNGMPSDIFSRFGLFSEPARKSFASPGLYLNPSKDLKNVDVAYYVYFNDQGQLVEQAILPTPYNWELMKNELQDQGFTQVRLAQDGVISANKNNILHRAFLSYEAKKVGMNIKTRIHRVEDLNGDGSHDARVVYKSDSDQFDSWEQVLYIFPENQGSNRL